MVSFEAVRRGDEGIVDLTSRIKSLIASGYLRTIEDVELPRGKRATGPRRDPSSDQGSGDAGDLDGGEAGLEPGEGTDAG